MVRANLKNNAVIEGFENALALEVWRNCDRNPIHWQNILYSGETKLIPEKLRELFDYGYDDLEIHFTSKAEAIKEACPDEYCVIYKTD